MKINDMVRWWEVGRLNNGNILLKEKVGKLVNVDSKKTATIRLLNNHTVHVECLWLYGVGKKHSSGGQVFYDNYKDRNRPATWEQEKKWLDKNPFT